MDTDKQQERVIRVYLDDDQEPFGEFKPPVKFLFDTTRIPDGKHTLRVVARSSSGKEGTRHIPFEVRNGPAISVLGLDDDEVLTDKVPITLNAYGSEHDKTFVITGSEDPKAIPAWMWALVLAFFAAGVFYLIMYWGPGHYTSF